MKGLRLGDTLTPADENLKIRQEREESAKFISRIPPTSSEPEANLHSFSLKPVGRVAWHFLNKPRRNHRLARCDSRYWTSVYEMELVEFLPLPFNRQDVGFCPWHRAGLRVAEM